MREPLRDVEAIAEQTAELIYRAAWGHADMAAELAKQVAERLVILVRHEVAGMSDETTLTIASASLLVRPTK